MQDLVSFSIVVDNPRGGAITMADMAGQVLVIDELPWDDLLTLAVMMFRGAITHAQGIGVEENEFISKFHQIQEDDLGEYEAGWKP